MQDQKLKPILFNTEMVKAILEGRKVVTRRLVKPQPAFFYDVGGVVRDPDNPEHIAFLAMQTDDHEEVRVPPYQPGEILYVRETWAFATCDPSDKIGTGYFAYRADGGEAPNGKWLPSIHMPKEAARIFLLVKYCRPERLWDMVMADVLLEGVAEGDSYKDTWNRWHDLWNSTIDPADIPAYGWEANPWVWVIGFERFE